MTWVTEHLDGVLTFLSCWVIVSYLIGKVRKQRERIHELECALDVISQIKGQVRGRTAGPYDLRAGDTLDFQALGLELAVTVDREVGITVVYVP